MTGKKILVTGANGQLGNEMRMMTAAYPLHYFSFVTKQELAIDDFAAIEKYFSLHSFDFCVNCAAYTAVDKAETERAKATLINGEAVGNLAMVCKAYDTKLIHISTDYVFDGTSSAPYLEADPVNPVNSYGATKLKGEIEALKNNPGSLIIRTSWVYSAFGNNFVKTMLRLMAEKESLNVVNDQQGCPTYAADLAAAIMHIINWLDSDEKLNHSLPASTIFNYCNEGVTTWYEFALAIKELSGSSCIVNPVPSSLYPTAAKRPGYSVMDTSKIQQTFNLSIPAWRDSLENCLKLLLTWR